ncbi:hypothetical protein LEL_06484 [Akanthomyces lecanii RCEF 1005]|uniref:Uncharacterized protein n=1 Tax=Akanthomyces lecanii RCEF 1005 TaxID=1081108 RepID=A0A168GQX7_CORDF|nr:hypothetical protein LEL_06484 [Akanthomyces lecanii RCEF 1005]
MRRILEIALMRESTTCLIIKSYHVYALWRHCPARSSATDKTMCRFILQQPLCPCPAGDRCSQLGWGSTVYKKKLFHFRGDALIRSAVCSEQLKQGNSAPRRDCPNTSDGSKKGWESDPYGCVRDMRICLACAECLRPDDAELGAALQRGTGD